jgi:hypothetical protein
MPRPWPGHDVNGLKIIRVTPALIAGIHVVTAFEIEDVDGRGKPGHDDGGSDKRAVV